MAKDIFLLEDDRRQAAAAITVLENAGFEVRVERDVQMATGYLIRQSRYEFAAILTDGQLGPGQNDTGMFFIRTLTALTKRYNALPFIGGSASTGFWDGFVPKNVAFHRIDKVWLGDYAGWDTTALLAKLAELGVTP